MSIHRHIAKDGTVSYHLRLRVVGADGTVHHAQRTVRGTKRAAQDARAQITAKPAYTPAPAGLMECYV